jgi:hypothetical protein
MIPVPATSNALNAYGEHLRFTHIEANVGKAIVDLL